MIEHCPWWVLVLAGVGLGAAPGRAADALIRIRSRGQQRVQKKLRD